MSDARGSLAGRVVALSLSPPGDGLRLGYPANEFDRMCFDLALRIVRAGGRVLYGGHLHEGSMTLAIFEHVAGVFSAGKLGTEAVRVPFLHFLSWHELSKTSFDRLARTLRSFGTFAEIRVVPRTSEQIRLWLATDMHSPPFIIADDATVSTGKRAIADQEALSAFHASRPPMTEAEALEVMRTAQREAAEARIVLGGRRGDLGLRERHLGIPGGDPEKEVDRYRGDMPGICEEVLVSLEAGHPIAIAAAFGGAARDTAIWLDLLPSEDAVPYIGNVQEGVKLARESLRAARDRLRGHRDTLCAFARRDDSEALARDIVNWISGEL